MFLSKYFEFGMYVCELLKQFNEYSVAPALFGILMVFLVGMLRILVKSHGKQCSRQGCSFKLKLGALKDY